MTGTSEVRRCGSCKQNVYNLSEMTRAQADDVLAANDAQMCMRYYHRADGTILLRDCAVEYRPVGLLVAAGAAALALAGAAMWPDGGPAAEGVDYQPAVSEPISLHAQAQEYEPTPPSAPPAPPAPPPIHRAPPQPEQIFVTGGVPPPPPRGVTSRR